MRKAVSLKNIPPKRITAGNVYNGLIDMHGFYIPDKQVYLNRNDYVLRPKTKKLNKIQLFFRKLGM